MAKSKKPAGRTAASKKKKPCGGCSEELAGHLKAVRELLSANLMANINVPTCPDSGSATLFCAEGVAPKIRCVNGVVSLDCPDAYWDPD